MTYLEAMQSLKVTLKKHGYSLSSARKTVFGLLHNKEPQSMRELQNRASGVIDRSSLYRTIDLFEMLDIVHRVHYGWKYKVELSEQYHSHHHHLTCERCGRVIAINVTDEIESQLKLLAKSNSFTPTTHQIELHGICSNCG